MSFACKVNEFTFTWKIRNFWWFHNFYNDELKSPMFSVDPARTTQFFLTLYPRGKGVTNHVSIYLNRDHLDEGPIWLAVRYEFEVVDSCKTFHQLHAESQVFRKGSSWGHQSFLVRTSLFESDTKTFLPEDVLTVRCHLLPAQEHFECPDENKHLEELSQNLGKLYLDKRNSDMTLCCGDKRFAAHMMVLVSRCPVLAESLKLETSQETTKEIALYDIDAAVLEGLLMYLYSGKLDGISLEQLRGLHSVAEKYKIVDLKAKLLLFASTVTVVTYISLKHESLTYTIESFKSILRKDCFRILSFSTFSLFLNVKGFSTAEHENIEIYVQCFPVQLEPSTLTCSLCLKGKDDKILNKVKSKILVSEKGTLKFPSFIARNVLGEEDSNSLDGALIFKFKIATWDGYVFENMSESRSVSSESKMPLYSSISLRQLSLDFQNLFISRRMCDIKLLAGGIPIPAHKAILCARSPVFSGILDHDKSKANTEYIIEDINYFSVYFMVMYMYTGRLNLSSYDDVPSLLYAARKYQILGLKDKCLGIMKLKFE